VVYDSSGLIVTAAHVVEGQETVDLRFDDGEQVEGTVLGAVSGVDIAVIQVDKDDLVAAVFNTDKPRVGQLAVAVGSPWGLESTVTAGIVSAVDQANCDFGGVCFSQVQTDAAINPGNSGGPLVDRNGQVIGINVSIRTESGANDGVGFAVPSDVVVQHAESIINGTLLETAFLGVEGQPATGDRAGAQITVVMSGTGAEDAGLQVDDIVIEFDGVGIFGIVDLAAQVRTNQPGDTVELTLIRDGEEITAEVVLGVRSEDASS
jgi:S1-C subfamily serine protease